MERCKKLLDTFFSRDGTSSGIILFPDIEITLHSQICQLKRWERVMSTLNAWCENSKPEDPTGLIIRNYDFKDHLHFCGATRDEIKDTLGFSNSADMFSFQESDTRFLTFNPSLKIILIIRLVELLGGELQLFEEEVNHCIHEVNLLCFLLKDELADTGVIVTGLVAYSGANAHSQSVCTDCNNVIVSFEIFNSVETFERFWESFFNVKKIKDLAVHVARNIKKDKVNVFQAIASKILGYLSHLQFATLQEPILPIPEQDATDNIKQAELLLNCYQMEIAYSDDKRIWLEGNYGTGKTVVALKKLELLLKALRDKEVIYYINFARKSLLDAMTKQRFKSKNVRAIRGEYSLSNTIKNQILREERKLGTKSIHLIVDEYSSQDLSTKEVESLIPILNNEEELINSTVLIAVQPIKIKRVENFCKNGIKRKLSETKHQLDKLATATGMKVKLLKNVMRTTVQINNLVEITREYLDNHSNRCVRQLQDYGIGQNLKEVADPNLDEISPFLIKRHQNVISDDSSNRAIKNPRFQPEKLIDYDEYHKLVHKEIKAAEIDYHEIVTSYSYPYRSQIGHGINGPLPQLIKFEGSANHCEQIALMAAVMDKIIEPIESKSNRIAVIHLEPDDPPFWLESLFQLVEISSSLTVTFKVGDFLEDFKSKNLVLVKNLNCLRGLEFSRVLLILDSNEHHLRQLIPEAIARCKTNLTVLIKRPVHEIHKSDTVADLADEWEKNLDNRILKIHKIGFCLKPSCNKRKVQLEAYCKDEKLFGINYGVHRNSKLYKDFLKLIQHKNIGNVQPQHIEKQKEAETL